MDVRYSGETQNCPISDWRTDLNNIFLLNHSDVPLWFLFLSTLLPSEWPQARECPASFLSFAVPVPKVPSPAHPLGVDDSPVSFRKT